MKCEAHGMQQPRHINRIGEGVSTAQRSNSLVQSINQRFPNAKKNVTATFLIRSLISLNIGNVQGGK